MNAQPRLALVVATLAAAGCSFDRPVAASRTLASTGSGGGAAVASSGCTACVFGPTTYTRGNGSPVTEVSSLPGDPAADYVIEIDDEGSQGADGSVLLNGAVILALRTGADVGPRHVQRSVYLDNQNSLEVRLTGKPGSSLKIRILGGSKMIDQNGGTVRSLDNVTRVSIPHGALSGPTLVSISPSSDIGATSAPQRVRLGSAREITIDGAILSAPALIEWQTPNSDGNRYLDGNGNLLDRARILRLDPATGQWVEVPQAYEASTQQVRAHTLQFSTWQLSAPIGPPPRSLGGSFVRTQGAYFVDGSGKRFQVAGANIPRLASNDMQLRRDRIIRLAKNQGFNVVRIWALPWTSSEHFTQFLTTALDSLQANGMKAILVLSNNWRNQFPENGIGGMDLATEQACQASGLPHTAFYTLPCARTNFQKHADSLITNYGAHEALMAWELANEPRCDGLGGFVKGGCEAAIDSWAREMSNSIGSKDPVHLVTLGDDGFITGGVSAFGKQGADATGIGIDTRSVIGIPGIHFVTYHLYPTLIYPPYVTPDAAVVEGWGVEYIRQHDPMLSTLPAKPVIMEEFGTPVRAVRPCTYAKWVTEANQRGSAGWLFWVLDDRPSYVAPEEDMYESDPASPTLLVLKQAASDTKKGNGTATSCAVFGLNLTISGLPAGGAASVTIIGPNNFSQHISGSVTLGPIEPGSYTLTAASVSVGSQSCIPTVPTQSVVVLQTSATSGTSVVYSCSSTSFSGALAPSARGSPAIDGVLSAGEWAGAATLQFAVDLPGLGQTTGTFYALNDATNVYFGVKLLPPSGASFSSSQVMNLWLFFHDFASGTTLSHGDNVLRVGTGPGTNGFGDYFVNLIGGGFRPDLGVGGTNDGARALTLAPSVLTMEAWHPLKGSDSAYDLQLTAGQSVGISVALDVLQSTLTERFITGPSLPSWPLTSTSFFLFRTR